MRIALSDFALSGVAEAHRQKEVTTPPGGSFETGQSQAFYIPAPIPIADHRCHLFNPFQRYFWRQTLQDPKRQFCLFDFSNERRTNDQHAMSRNQVRAFGDGLAGKFHAVAVLTCNEIGGGAHGVVNSSVATGQQVARAEPGSGIGMHQCFVTPSKEGIGKCN